MFVNIFCTVSCGREIIFVHSAEAGAQMVLIAEQSTAGKQKTIPHYSMLHCADVLETLSLGWWPFMLPRKGGNA